MCINSVAFSYSSELNWLSFSTFFCLSSIVNCVYLIRMTHIGGRGRFTLFFVFMMIDKYCVDFCKYSMDTDCALFSTFCISRMKTVV